MGILKFLKKKDQKETVELTPSNQNPEELKKQLLGKKDDVPPIEDIPLPPAADMPSSTKGKKEEIKDETLNIEDPIISQEDSLEEPDKLEEQIEKKPVSSEMQDEFALPEFTDEELGFADNTKEVEEPKTEEIEIEKVEEPEEEPAITEINTSIISDDVKVEPLVKTEGEQKGSDYYLNVECCSEIFTKIKNNQMIISDAKNIIQKHEFRNKNILQTYKNFHDNIDSIQEKLMEIDNSLFER